MITAQLLPQVLPQQANQGNLQQRYPRQQVQSPHQLLRQATTRQPGHLLVKGHVLAPPVRSREAESHLMQLQQSLQGSGLGPELNPTFATTAPATAVVPSCVIGASA